MRTLEEWFKYVETFDHTTDGPDEDQVPERSDAPSQQRPAQDPKPDADRVDPPGDAFARRYGARTEAARTFRSAPAPQPRPAPRPQTVLPAPDALPKESRDQLLARLLDPVLTLEEAAQVLDVCPTTVRRYTNKGLLRHYRTSGNQRRFRLSHVLKFLDETGGRIETGTLAEGPEASTLARRPRVRVRSAMKPKSA